MRSICRTPYRKNTLAHRSFITRNSVIDAVHRLDLLGESVNSHNIIMYSFDRCYSRIYQGYECSNGSDQAIVMRCHRADVRLVLKRIYSTFHTFPSVLLFPFLCSLIVSQSTYFLNESLSSLVVGFYAFDDFFKYCFSLGRETHFKYGIKNSYRYNSFSMIR